MTGFREPSSSLRGEGRSAKPERSPAPHQDTLSSPSTRTQLSKLPAITGEHHWGSPQTQARETDAAGRSLQRTPRQLLKHMQCSFASLRQSSAHSVSMLCSVRWVMAAGEGLRSTCSTQGGHSHDLQAWRWHRVLTDSTSLLFSTTCSKVSLVSSSHRLMNVFISWAMEGSGLPSHRI